MYKLSFREREKRFYRERGLARDRDDPTSRAFVVDDQDHIRLRVARPEREANLRTIAISRDQFDVTWLSPLAIHDRQDRLARQARELSRLARLELDAQTLTSSIRDKFLEVVASPVRRFRALSPFVGEEFGAHFARREFSIGGHAHWRQQELALRSFDFVRD